jgi:hypothetical protein
VASAFGGPAQRTSSSTVVTAVSARAVLRPHREKIRVSSCVSTKLAKASGDAPRAAK